MESREIVNDSASTYKPAERESRTASEQLVLKSSRSDDLAGEKVEQADDLNSLNQSPRQSVPQSDPYARVPYIGTYSLEDINAYISLRTSKAMTWNNPVATTAQDQVTYYTAGAAPQAAKQLMELSSSSSSNPNNQEQNDKPTEHIQLTKWKSTTTPPDIAPRPDVEEFTDNDEPFTEEEMEALFGDDEDRNRDAAEHLAYWRDLPSDDL